MDILRHGPEVQVLAPKDLRHAVREALSAALTLYPETLSLEQRHGRAKTP
jgi:hypothetical protein